MAIWQQVMTPRNISALVIKFYANDREGEAEPTFEVTRNGCTAITREHPGTAELSQSGRSIGEELFVQLRVTEAQLQQWHSALSMRYPSAYKHDMQSVAEFIGDSSRLLVQRNIAPELRGLFASTGNEFDAHFNSSGQWPGTMPMIVYRSEGDNPEYGKLTWLGVSRQTGEKLGGGGPLQQLIIGVRSPFPSAPVEALTDLKAIEIPPGVDGVTAIGASDGMPLAIASNNPSETLLVDPQNAHLQRWLASWRFLSPQLTPAFLNSSAHN